MKTKGLLYVSASLMAMVPAAAQAQPARAGAVTGSAAPAQEVPASPVTEQSQQEEDPGSDEIVVTGVTAGTRKRDATFSINTVDQADIQRLAPISTADLLANIPGFFSEGSTAGEASNNITVRGLPAAGGYRYAPQLIDGLPVYEEPEAPFMNNDVFIRTDLMTDRVEVVKGGPGGILYSNGLGATVNYVTRTGKQKFEGGYKLEVADYSFLRQEAFVSGPINKNLTFAVGGFTRISGGLRDTGYRADDGGQIRANLLYTSDDSRTTVLAQGLYINDRTAFYQNVPFSVPRVPATGGTADNPVTLRQGDIQPLGISFSDGTFASRYNRYFTQLGEYGQRQVDFADGIHPEFGIFTLKGSREFDSGWKVNLGARYTTGSSGFNGLFVGNDTNTAQNFLTARLQNDVINPAYNAALSCNLSNAKLIGYFTVPTNPCAAFANISREDFVRNYARFTRVAGRRTTDGSDIGPTEYMNFLIPFIGRTEADSLSVDLQVQKTVQLFGEHQFTAGVYGSRYNWDVDFQTSVLASDVQTEPRLADLLVVDANGMQVGPSLTRNGNLVPSSGGFVTTTEQQGLALYLLDHWESPDRRLKVDIGGRYQRLKANVFRRDRSTLANLTPAGVVPGSLNDSTYDDEVQVPGAAVRTLNKTYDAFGWSVGANYSLSRPLAVYGLLSNSFRLPSLGDLNDLSVNQAQLITSPQNDAEPIERILQLEGGVRFLKRQFDASVAVFYNDFKPREFLNVYRDFQAPSCVAAGGIVQLNTCPEVAQSYRRGIRNFGTEIELAVRPAFLDGFELRGNVVVQDPRVKDASFTTVQEVRDPAGALTAYRFVTVSEDGRRPRRLPTLLVNLRPSFDFAPSTGVPLTIFAQGFYYSKRFSESSDQNVTVYPSYYIINAGAAVEVSSKMSLQVNVSNLTNELSFTEGDPVFPDLLSPDGTRNRSVGRPLFGRIARASLTYRF